MTILTNFHKKGCWILSKSHYSSDANKPYEGIKKSLTKNKFKMRSSTQGVSLN